MFIELPGLILYLKVKQEECKNKQTREIFSGKTYPVNFADTERIYNSSTFFLAQGVFRKNLSDD